MANGICYLTGKESYSTLLDAKRAGNRLGLAHYACKKCGGWHLTKTSKGKFNPRDKDVPKGTRPLLRKRRL